MFGRLISTAAVIGCYGCIYAQGTFTTPEGFQVTVEPYPGYPAYSTLAKDISGNGKFYVSTGPSTGAPAGVAALYVAINWLTSTSTAYSGTCSAEVVPTFRWNLTVVPPAGTTVATIYVPVIFDWGQYTSAGANTSSYHEDNFWAEGSTSNTYGSTETLANVNPAYINQLTAFSPYVPTNSPYVPGAGLFSDFQVSNSTQWKLTDVSKISETVYVACSLQQDGNYAGSSEIFYVPAEGALQGYAAFDQPVSSGQNTYFAKAYSLSAVAPMFVGVGDVRPAQGPAPVELGLAGNYAVFADTGISNATTPAAITGNIGVGPGVTSTAITGFALNLPAGSPYSTSAQVSGKVYAFDYAEPTPANVTTASQDMGDAYNDAAGRIHPNYLNLEGGNLAGLTLYPGLYTWGTAVTLPFGTNVTLSGGPNDVWIFQISGTLTTGAATHVFLTGGAQASNVFWQVAGTSVTLGANAQFAGIVLAKVAINFGNQAQETGRLLAQTAVNLNQNAVTQP